MSKKCYFAHFAKEPKLKLTNGEFQKVVAYYNKDNDEDDTPQMFVLTDDNLLIFNVDEIRQTLHKEDKEFLQEMSDKLHDHEINGGNIGIGMDNLWQILTIILDEPK